MASALPDHRLDGFAKGRQLEGERAIGVQAERGAVEYQFVLTADLIDVDERQVAFGHARDRDVEAHLVLVVRIGEPLGTIINSEPVSARHSTTSS